MPVDAREYTGEPLREKLREAATSNRELARFLGVAESTVRRWLSETCHPEGETIAEIESFFEDLLPVAGPRR